MRLIPLAALFFFLLVAGCENSKEKDYRDVVFTPNFIWAFLVTGTYLEYLPCGYDHYLKSGDVLSLQIDPERKKNYTTVYGCSKSSWTLTIYPPPDGKVLVYQYTYPGCWKNEIYLGSSKSPGQEVRISGDAGCIAPDQSSLHVSVSGSGGSVFHVVYK